MDSVFLLILLVGVIILVHTVVRIPSQIQPVIAKLDAMKSELQELKAVEKEYLGKICDGLLAVKMVVGMAVKVKEGSTEA
jgi:hypothetical protein